MQYIHRPISDGAYTVDIQTTNDKQSFKRVLRLHAVYDNNAIIIHKYHHYCFVGSIIRRAISRQVSLNEYKQGRWMLPQKLPSHIDE
jgi:hypothetical protein